MRWFYSGTVRPNVNLHPPPAPLGTLKSFAYKHNVDACGNNPVYMVVLVDSSPNRRGNRVGVRMSHGRARVPSYPIVTLFLMGSTPSEQPAVDIEAQQYHDIIQGNFVDDARNMSVANLMGIRWVHTYCPQAKFVMRADDNALFDIYQLVDVMDMSFGTMPRFMGCASITVNNKPVRDTNPAYKRWHLSLAEFPHDVFYPYCDHDLFFFTPALGKEMDTKALTVHIGEPINNIYITGVLMHELGINLRSLDFALNPDGNFWHNWIKQTPKPVLPPSYPLAPFANANADTAREVYLVLRRVSKEAKIPLGHYCD